MVVKAHMDLCFTLMSGYLIETLAQTGRANKQVPDRHFCSALKVCLLEASREISHVGRLPAPSYLSRVNVHMTESGS
jgi:hypothetical protein